ncbi:hypothetical protein PV328_000829 [Microctonus aethiopoides]|uniref:Ribonuclease P protein subunit p20 n=1 Tax=Microctonus aethiopoides TaxID=144406 RepID=A0AA39FVX7_9HYME|nr:hypothetical protein PV328_000829 [Microctonus aethiopoides]
MAEEISKGKLGNNKNILFNELTATQLTSQHHVKQRRIPLYNSKTKKNIYVTHKGSFKAQLNRCEKCLNSDESEITIHGLGAAANRAQKLALQLQKNHNGMLDLDITTSIVELIDDIEPSDDEKDCEINNRQKSATHIKVTRKVKIGPLKYAK